MQAIRLTLLLMLCLAGTVPASGQVSFGLRVGVSATTLQGGDEAEGKLGVLAGGLVDVPLARRLRIQPEILVSQRGGQVARDGVAATPAFTYLELPVLVGFRLRADEALVVTVQVGPQVGLPLDRSGGGAAEVVATSRPRADIGWVAGGEAGARLARIGHMVGVSVRYGSGVSPMLDAPELTSRAFSVSAFWRL
jgi:hypothetical protein